MVFRLGDRVQETTTTVGTGILALNGPLPQSQSFAVGIGSGNTTWYCLVSGDGVNWETGLCTIGGSGGAFTLTRTQVYASSNADDPISISGTSQVFCDVPASQFGNTGTSESGGSLSFIAGAGLQGGAVTNGGTVALEPTLLSAILAAELITPTDLAINYDTGSSLAGMPATRTQLAVDTGVANAYVITPTIPWTSYQKGDRIIVQITHANTAASTLNVSELGAEAIQQAGVAIASGVLIQYNYYIFYYNGTTFQVSDAINSPYYFGIDTGAADAYGVATTTPLSFPALYPGLSIAVTIANNNTGSVAATLNIAPLGAVTITGTNGVANALIAGTTYIFTYSGSAFHFIPAIPTLTGQPDAPGLTIEGNGNTNSIAIPAIIYGMDNTIDALSESSAIFGDTNVITNSDNIAIYGNNNSVNTSGAAVVVGFGNILNESFSGQAIISGNSNVINTSDELLVMGNNNVVSQAQQSAVFGNTNTVVGGGSGEQMMILGDENHSSHDVASLVIGFSNTTSTNSELLIVGGGNTATAQQSAVFGNSNTITNGSSEVIIAGTGNSSNDDTESAVFGFGNTLVTNNQIIVVGNTNTTTNSDQSGIIGNNNTLTSDVFGVLVVGEDNTVSASASYSVVVGATNTSSGQGQLIIGKENNISGANAVAIGNQNTITAESAVGFGNGITLTGAGSIGFGDNASDNGNIGALVHSAGTAIAPNYAQTEEYVFSTTITDTPTQLTTDGNAPSLENVAALPDNTAVMFSINILAYDTTTPAALTWSIQNCLGIRSTGAASMIVEVANTSFVLGAITAGAPTVPAPTVTADTTNGGFAITFTPPAGNTDTWNVVARLVLLKT